jgi:Na+/proline symporter
MQAIGRFVTGAAQRVSANPAVQYAAAEVQTTSTSGLLLFCTFPLILGICVMSKVAQSDTIQNSNLFQLLLTACLLLGFCVFGILLHIFQLNNNQDMLMYTILALCFFCFALVVGNGGIAVMLADSYNTANQWIQKADN